MLYLLAFAFAISLIYLSVAERFRNYSRLIGLQGFLVFGISMVLIKELNWLSVTLISIETLVFKAIAVPYFLFRIINKLKIYKVHERALPAFYILMLTIAGLILSIITADTLAGDNVNIVLLTVSFFCMYVGILIIITHKLIFSHMIGFLIIENAVFLFSIAIGSEMPMLINIGILLDIFVSVLIITVLINRIGSQFTDLGAENLSKLKH
ncbi:MAG: hypothetical protein A2W91_11925 [Bacteroidetes bacterium GWF2_38_335]|nr:MAG: hypothetical protein A2W91_11925 [Bacteroidetes bacterium GWF2_38_335]OFY76882.1 MAG: hypothetical protein A2281_00040 [Bacteroidetes bacterium RIFOXYA12_FULL_38_20]HBS86729.1 hypothetical protein [Bacteroidales bacterium]